MRTMIRITAKREGFRRAGMAHFGTRDHPEGTFTPEQLDALYGDPMLVVDEVDVPDLDDVAKAEGDIKAAKAQKAAKANLETASGATESNTDTAAKGGK